jgi:hypothetical protein
MIDEKLIDAAAEMAKRPGRDQPEDIFLNYNEWKKLGGKDLPGAEHGGGYVHIRKGNAAYIVDVT